jgi:hypothetical protein
MSLRVDTARTARNDHEPGISGSDATRVCGPKSHVARVTRAADAHANLAEQLASARVEDDRRWSWQVQQPTGVSLVSEEHDSHVGVCQLSRLVGRCRSSLAVERLKPAREFGLSIGT